MFRYIALVWHAASEQQSHAAESLDAALRAKSWSRVLGVSGLRVFCAGAESGMLRALPLARECGVILGTIFERHRASDDDSISRAATPGAHDCEAILASRGRWLIEHCWGNYVAILRDAASGVVHVVKDPTGTLPCFITRARELTIAFSHIGDCLALGLRHFTVDRAWLRTRTLGFGDLERNAIEHVEQVRRGECVDIDPATPTAVRSRRFYWNPLAFLEGRPAIEDPQRAAAAVRATVRSCTQTLAGGHASVLHRLSGGLDSSIVSGCLGRAHGGPHVTCYTYFNPLGRSDERPWARLAAEHTGFEHVEYPIVPAEVDFAALLRPRPAPEPLPLLAYLVRSTVEHRLAADRKATAVFTGDGGDSGFCSDSVAYAVTDYLRHHGPRLRALRLAAQVALRTERSTWTTLSSSLRRWLFGSQMREQIPALLLGSRLVSQELRESSIPGGYPHPWFSHLRTVPWDALRRVGALVLTPDFYNVGDAADPEPEVVAPLYAQPAIELFLRIPIHVHAEGGRDRALARRAFVRDVPEPILQRQWKDRAPGFHSELLLRNLDLVREVLLDGVLVREGMLDRAAVQAAFAPGPSKTDVLPAEVFRHLEVEVWARYWMR